MPKNFDKETLENWMQAVDTHCPDAPTSADMGDMPQVASFSGAISESGIALIFADAEGIEHPLVLNAVVARSLIGFIAKTGQDGGWLDEQLNLISRDLSLDA